MSAVYFYIFQLRRPLEHPRQFMTADVIKNLPRRSYVMELRIESQNFDIQVECATSCLIENVVFIFAGRPFSEFVGRFHRYRMSTLRTYVHESAWQLQEPHPLAPSLFLHLGGRAFGRWGTRLLDGDLPP